MMTEDDANDTLEEALDQITSHQADQPDQDIAHVTLTFDLSSTRSNYNVQGRQAKIAELADTIMTVEDMAIDTSARTITCKGATTLALAHFTAAVYSSAVADMVKDVRYRANVSLYKNRRARTSSLLDGNTN